MTIPLHSVEMINNGPFAARTRVESGWIYSAPSNCVFVPDPPDYPAAVRAVLADLIDIGADFSEFTKDWRNTKDPAEMLMQRRVAAALVWLGDRLSGTEMKGAL